MIRLLRLALAACVLPALGWSSKKPEVVRCVTWNLQWFPGKSPSPTPEAITDHIREVQFALKELRPDILILQEVSGQPVVEEAISMIPEMKVAVVSRFTRGGLIDGQQIAICSKFPADVVYSSTWNTGWAGPPRGFAFAAIKCRGSLIFTVGLHLKSNLGDAQGNTAKREDAIEQVLAHVTRTEKEFAAAVPKWIIAGDFNTDQTNRDVPSERTFPLLLKAGCVWAFEGVPLEKRITCPAKGRYPSASFDHFFIKGLGSPVASPQPDIPGSDHLPVVVDLVLPGE